MDAAGGRAVSGTRWLDRLRHGLVVSCQALPGEPLHGHMLAMAQAAREGGARGVLVNGATDIAACRTRVGLPVIGVATCAYPDSDISLTPTLAEIDAIEAAGADLAGLDATDRPRPGGATLEAFLESIRGRYPALPLMAEVATDAEAERAQALGFECVSSAAFGYTARTAGRRLPDDDFAALRRLRAILRHCPLVAEGGLDTPAQAARALELGADFVVVGSAITRPQRLTQRFAAALHAVDANA